MTLTKDGQDDRPNRGARREAETNPRSSPPPALPSLNENRVNIGLQDNIQHIQLYCGKHFTNIPLAKKDLFLSVAGSSWMLTKEVSLFVLLLVAEGRERRRGRQVVFAQNYKEEYQWKHL